MTTNGIEPSRTWEDAIKRDSGLAVGTYCVTLEHRGEQSRALVEITPLGRVYLLFEPRAIDVQGLWLEVVGDRLQHPPQGRDTLVTWAASGKLQRDKFNHSVAIIRKCLA